MTRLTLRPLWQQSVLVPFYILLFCFPGKTQENQSPDHDTSYYQSYPGSIIGRFYFSRKFTNLELEKGSGASSFRYQPNTPLNMGVGITFHTITLNLGYGFGFLNPEDGKGKTKYLDLQTHIYGRKWTIDVLGQFYKGYYLSPQGLGMQNPQAYYIRPDIRINMFGGAAYHLFNWDRFSYRASIFQDEKQKKSAGSFLLGGEAYYGIVKADSSLVPSVLTDQYTQKFVRSLRFLKIGPGAGYAHTFIIATNFFFTASLQANLGLEFVTQSGAASGKTRVTLSPGYIYRFVAGYDKGLYNLNFAVLGNQITLKASTTNDKYYITTGAYRLTLTRRFNPGPVLTRRLRPVEDMLP